MISPIVWRFEIIDVLHVIKAYGYAFEDTSEREILRSAVDLIELSEKYTAKPMAVLENEAAKIFKDGWKISAHFKIIFKDNNELKKFIMCINNQRGF